MRVTRRQLRQIIQEEISNLTESRYEDWDEPWGHAAAGASEERSDDLEGQLLDYLRKSAWTSDNVRSTAIAMDVIDDLRMDDWRLFSKLTDWYGGVNELAMTIAAMRGEW